MAERPGAPKFDYTRPCSTRRGTTAEVLGVQGDTLVTRWFDGIRWHITEHNIDGSYGLKEAPNYLEGRQGHGADIFAAVQDDKPCSLDLVNIDDTDQAA